MRIVTGSPLENSSDRDARVRRVAVYFSDNQKFSDLREEGQMSKAIVLVSGPAAQAVEREPDRLQLGDAVRVGRLPPHGQTQIHRVIVVDED